METILSQKFDYIFFTGSTTIGKQIMQAAAKQLTPITLELGGKNPCIIDETANLDFAAKRIVWAKFMNAGQTCIAPNHLYVHASCKQALLQKIILYIEKFYNLPSEMNEKGDRRSPLQFGCIINQHHFDRLTHLMQNTNIIFGGKTNPEKRYIAPTLIDQVSLTDPIMQEEVFGPLLPILTFEKLNEVIEYHQSQPKPLAAYFFTQHKLH